MAEGTARRAAAAARGADGGGEERFLAFGDMEGLIRANQALVDSTSELGRGWLVCWQEQFVEGMALTREVLERQGTFVRSSLERLNAQAARSAEVTSGMVDGYLAPLRESRAATRPSA